MRGYTAVYKVLLCRNSLIWVVLTIMAQTIVLVSQPNPFQNMIERPAMAELYFVAEDPTNTSSRYASRISQSTWAQYRETIQALHDTGLTRRQILEELAQYSFNPS